MTRAATPLELAKHGLRCIQRDAHETVEYGGKKVFYDGRMCGRVAGDVLELVEMQELATSWRGRAMRVWGHVQAAVDRVRAWGPADLVNWQDDGDIVSFGLSGMRSVGPVIDELRLTLWVNGLRLHQPGPTTPNVLVRWWEALEARAQARAARHQEEIRG